MRRFSLATAILILCLLAAAAMLAQAIIAIHGTLRIGGLLTRAITADEALSNHQNTDMMHDAIRGDILSLRLATTAAERDAAAADLKEHAATFRAMIAANHALDIDQAIRAVLTEAEPVAEAYVSQAETLFAKAQSDREAALALLPAYNASFAAAEEKLGAVTDAINAQVGTLRAERDQVRQQVLIATFIAAGSAFITLFIAGRWLLGRITRPVATMRDALTRMAGGDWSTVPRIASNDELGDMSQALTRMAEHMRGLFQGIGKHSGSLDQASTQLNQESTSLLSASKATTQESATVSTAIDQVAANLESVAAAASELSLSVREISTRTNDTARVASEAVVVTRNVGQAMDRLGTSSQEIGAVVSTISDIARQTTLLALNATIEAVSAGEAGRGFVVVANEVKALAAQASRAASDISQRVSLVQTDVLNSAQAITGIVTIIQRIDEASQAIAGAVEEQSATTNEIARVMADATAGGHRIRDAASTVSTSATSTNATAQELQTQAAIITDAASELRRLISGLRC